MSFRKKCILGKVIFWVALFVGTGLFIAGYLLFQESFFNILSFAGIALAIAGCVFDFRASRCPNCGVPINGIMHAYCPWCGEFLDEPGKERPDLVDCPDDSKTQEEQND